MFKSDDKERYFHIIWDHTLERKHRTKLYNGIESKEKTLSKIISRKSILSEDELNVYRCCFEIEYHRAGKVEVNKRGRGKGKKEVDGFIVDSAVRDTEKIDHELSKCGFYILVTSQEMTVTEVMKAYTKRDCVEKVFRALKSYLGMDKIGVHTDDSIHAKTLVWFVAAVLHSLIFDKTATLRVTDKKTYTVPSIVDLLDEICADKNLSTMAYERRYKPTAKQNRIMKAMGISVKDVDECISYLNVG